MIAGTENEVDLFFFDVGLAPIEADLPAPLEVFPTARQHVEIGLGCGVIERKPGLEVFNRRFRGKPVEGSPHAGLAIRSGFARVALATDSRVHVSVVCRGPGGRRDYAKADRKNR